ncbi:hypothetical protein ACH5RR_027588 [Cinchona calisaya]|uniref:Cucumisin n=1 Tax=Cinchona calisaya TaxID=153742 RepID=A0ABD2Z7S0_9GENT
MGWGGEFTDSSSMKRRKIIGGKHYRSDGQVPTGDIPSPRDSEGHGSHTASTAAGRVVSKASLFNLGLGTARGGVPSARIAVYKICWADGCYDADILAAFDDGIADGVDIISLSVGGSFPKNYFEDSIAIGAFHSMKNGILTSNSAGNSGPGAGSITNFSPWSLSVAASVIDRKFVTNVQLGNNKIYQGVTVNTFQLNNKLYPLVYGGDVPNTAAGFDSSESRYCIYDSLDKTKVNGNIVLCDELSDGTATWAAGAIGTVMQDGGFKDFGFLFPLSASYLGTEDGSTVLNYINSTSKPTATIQKSNQIIDNAAPYVVSFSSRGPNPITRDILKPDLSAPGVDIVAAWSEATSITAAYVKSFNPTWSPAAIKSALMTTATPMSTKTNTDAEFAYGSGQINPLNATNPGLVYDAGEADFVSFLCSQGYNTTALQLVTGDKATSCTKANNATVWDLNYPSFTVSATSGQVIRIFHRTVTNVGNPVSTYKAIVNVPSQISIKVDPNVLSFQSLGQKLSFTVTVTAQIPSTIISGALVWDDGVYQVRSPVVAHAYA